MAYTTVEAGLQVEQWERDFHVEYVRDSRFKRYMGKSSNSIIQTNMVLEGAPGTTITFGLVTRLTGSGVTGDNRLMGNEEALSNYSQEVTINQLRNAVAVGDFEQKKTFIDLLDAARDALKNWAMEKLRDDIIARYMSPHVDGTTTYGSSTEAQKDTWLQNNVDRVLFGAAKSNTAGGSGTEDHSSSLANVDSSSDTLSPAMVSLAKRMARDADPHIRPVVIKEDEEWFVLFANKWAFRDFKSNAAYQQAARDGWTRGPDNPLFRDGDLVWEGMIIREIVEIPVISGVGASSIDVAPNFVCGAQSMFVCWGRRTRAIQQDDDYGNINGVGVAEIRGVEKATFNSTQHGLLTLYTAGVADT